LNAGAIAGLLKIHFFSSLVVGGALALAACSAMPPPAPASPNAAVTANSKPAPVAIQTGDSAIASTAVTAIGLPQPPISLSNAERELERGGASWYGLAFHGKRTANGERYDMNALTAAHKTLPFGTMVRVKSLVNGREVLVRITDRGPFIRNRIIDLSRAAASELDMLNLGFKQVVLTVAEEQVVNPPSAAAKMAKRR
jgi:rare lipoprotein A